MYLTVYMYYTETRHMAQKSCTFDVDICEGWTLRGQIVSTSTHDFTTSYNYTDNGGMYLCDKFYT